jgi:hypothetical protein
VVLCPTYIYLCVILLHSNHIFSIQSSEFFCDNSETVRLSLFSSLWKGNLKYLIFVFSIIFYLSPTIFGLDFARFVPIEKPRFVRSQQHDVDHFFLNPIFLTYDDTGFSSGGISEVNDESWSVRDAYFFPNPFSLSSGAELGYELPRDMDIELRIYNMMGNQVYRAEYPAGTNGGLGRGVNRNVYNRIPFNQSTFSAPLSSGIYFFVLMSDGKVECKGKFAIKPR